MRIIELHIKNLNSLRLETSISFTGAPLGNTGLFAITGDTGSGKSTILDAITLALYGRTPRYGKSSQPEVLSHGAAEAHAKVVFEAGGRQYLAEWSIRKAKGKTDGKLRPSERRLSEILPDTDNHPILAEKSSEVDAMVADITGLDFERFLRSVLLAQGQFAAFLQASAKDRSELLERITGLEIYTQLSIAARKRFEKEEAGLQELIRRKEQLKLLSKEEKKTLKTRQTETQDKIATLRQQLKESRDLLHLIGQTGKIQSAIDVLKQEETALEGDFLSLDASKLRLSRHRQVLHLKSDLDFLSQAGTQKQIAADRLEVIQQVELPEKTALSTQLLAAIQAAQQQLDDKRLLFPEKTQVLDQVMEWDIEISRLRKQAEQEEKAIAEGEESLKNIRAQLEFQQKTAEGLQPRLDTLDAWLASHSSLQSLDSDWNLLVRAAKEWRESKEKAAGQTAKLKTLQKELDQEEQNLQVSTGRLNDLKTRIESSRQRLAGLHPGIFAQSRAELVEIQNRELQQWKEKIDLLDRLAPLQSGYRKLLEEQNEYAAQLQSLESQEFHLVQLLLAASEELDRLQEDHEYKRGIYIQQQRIANYQKDRQTLQEGEPCPLCLSTHHPFHEHPAVETYADKAEEDYNRSRERAEKQQKVQNDLIRLLNQLAGKKQALAGEDDKPLSGMVARQNRRIEELEGQMKSLFKGFEEWELLHNPDFSRQRRQWYGEQYDALQETWNAIMREAAGWESLQLEERNQEKIHQKLEFAIRSLQSEIRILNQNLSENLDLCRDRESELGQILAKYGFQLVERDLQVQLDQLEADHKSLKQNQTEASRLKEDIRIARESARALEEKTSRETSFLEGLRNGLDQTRQTLSSLEAQRIATLGDQDPRLERQRLLDEMDALQEAINGDTARQAAAMLNVQALEQEAGRLAAELAKLETAIAQTGGALSAKLEKAGFFSPEEARDALLPLEEADALESRINELQQRKTEIQQGLKTLSGQLEDLQAQLPPAWNLNDLQTRDSEMDKQLGASQVSLGELKKALEQSRIVEKEAGELEISIARQKEETARWKALDDLIGSAGGQKFRTFAQGLTLERLVYLANHHLAQLNGRYLIRKIAGEELELEIVDTYQANNARSMLTLSGGETFLVSLSLALGLSDLAGQRTEIRSLFIDEGFGALDEASLDLAISTLENLQAKGKTIGIISHVKELKERIATQIQVVKRSNGFSEVEVVGG